MGWDLLWLFLFLLAVFKILGDELKEVVETFFTGIRNLLDAKPTINAVNIVTLVLIFLAALSLGGGLPEWLAPKAETEQGGAYFLAARDVGLIGAMVLALFLCLKAMKAGRR